jgi:carbon storage regulator
MLVLSRRMNQCLTIGDSIEITVVEIRDGHVRLGISAPRSVPVYRKELLDQIAAENAEAAESAHVPDDVSGGTLLATNDKLPVVAVLSPSGQSRQDPKGG